MPDRPQLPAPSAHASAHPSAHSTSGESPAHDSPGSGPLTRHPPTESRGSLLPLGALAAGFGFSLALTPVMAQTTTPGAGSPATRGAETVLPTVTVRGVIDNEAKESVRTTTTTLGRGQQDIRDIPQAITVVTEKLIDDVKLDTLRQALHYTSGITFAATENGTDQDIRLRGFPVATTGDLLIDGMKDPSQYDRDAFVYDRIEVMRGSASMLFGRGSTGGVINQVMKKPMLADVSEVGLTAGTGSYFRLTGDLNVRTGETEAFRLNAMFTKADNWGAKIDKRGIAPSYSWGIDTRNEVTISGYYLHLDNVPMSGLGYLQGGINENIRARNFYGTKSDYLTGEAAFLSASWKHRLDNGGEIRSQIRSGVFHRNFWGSVARYCGAPALTATGTCPQGAPAMTRDQVNNDTLMTRSGLAPRKDKYKATYLQSDFSKAFDVLGRKNDVMAGIDASHESVDRFGGYGTVTTNYNKGPTRVGSPNDGARTAATPTYRPTSDYQATGIGVFAQDLISLTDQWKLLGGLRYDRFKADTNQITYGQDGAVTARPSSELNYSSLWSRRFGVLYQPSSTQSYHLSYGTSFNTSADTYQYTTQAVADVPAESSRNIELGAKLDWLDGRLSTRAAIFRTEKYNERTTDSDFAGTSYTLSGKRHSQGIDIDVIGLITPKLEIYASYTWIQRARIDRAGITVNNAGVASTATGQPVGLTPRHSGAVWLGYKLMPDLRVGLGVRGMSENRPLQGATGAASQTVKVPGYLAYDAMAEYRINPDMFVQLNLMNLSNKVYADQLYPGFYIPGEGRTAKVSFGYRF